jgi:hypothetical protein
LGIKTGWSPEANAQTTDDKIGNEATTIFDMDKYKEATDLALARTMLHESAHAYLVRYFDSNPAAANKTYAELLEFYDQKGKLEPAHHETFVNTFVQQIAGALSKYGDSKNYKFASADEKRQFYQNMAWGGLHTTDAFKALSPSIQKGIMETLQLEQYNQKPSNSTNTQKGTKLKC